MAKTKLVDGVRVTMSDSESDAVQAEWDANAIVTANEKLAEAALAYRRARKTEYIDQIGTEKSYDETIGDVLDILITEIQALSGTRTSAFTSMVNKISAIKFDNPKPYLG